MRPFVFINVAASLDGKISDETRRQIRISCPQDLQRVDELRAASDAIMVGIGTVLSDDPRLTVKSEELRAKRVLRGKPANPIRVIVDSKCRVPESAKVLDRSAETIVAVSNSADEEKVRRISRLATVVRFGSEKVDLVALLDYLHGVGVRRLMVEGGGTLISSLLAAELVDEVYIYYAPIFIGGSESPTICDGRSFEVPKKFEIISVERLGEGVLVRARATSASP